MRSLAACHKTDLSRTTFQDTNSTLLPINIVSVRISILPSVIKITLFIFILGVPLRSFFIIPLGHAKNSLTDGIPSHKTSLPQKFTFSGPPSCLAEHKKTFKISFHYVLCQSKLIMEFRSFKVQKCTISSQ